MKGPCEAIALMATLLDSVAVVHGDGYAHRDIKPDNVILSEDENGKPQAVLVDFGLTCVNESRERDRSIECDPRPAGDLKYAAPEVLGDRLLTPSDARLTGHERRLAVGRAWQAADMYSVGATIFEILAGRTLQGRRGETFSPIAGLPPCLNELLARLLSEDPSQRPARGVGQDGAGRVRDRVRVYTPAAGRYRLIGDAGWPWLRPPTRFKKSCARASNVMPCG